MFILFVVSDWKTPNTPIAFKNVAVDIHISTALQQRGAKNVEFQPVGDLNKTYLYSAYYDNRSSPMIRIIAIVRNYSPLDTFICVSQTETKNLTIHETQLEFIPEPRSWGYAYQSAMIICKLTNSTQNTETVSVIEKSALRTNITLRPLNYMNVTKNKLKQNFSRCIPVLHDFHDKMALIQMLETDILLGMEHFIMYYNDDYPSTVGGVLEFYQSKGFLELHHWNLPINTGDIHYYGQIANMHDCLYRLMHRSKYVLFADIDEVVISPVFKSWLDLTNNLLKPNCASLQFPNVFFPIAFKSTNKKFSGMTDALKYNMTFFLKTTQTKVHSIGDRSKQLVKPESIYFLNIHSVLTYYCKESQTRPDSVYILYIYPVLKYFNMDPQTCNVNHKDAMLHHYRNNVTSDMNKPYVENTIMHTLSGHLIPNILKTMNSIK
ncbi:hypothetical protein SNE40_013699 [Patella caerulea]|uniref:Glycosyltransferase family 92 protein n=1 Tax=Patella caerulea TaxID=87958 RepID=A0AAN8PFV5_PATCE